MAVILYKKGNQIQICNEFSYLHLLDEGWHYTPEEVLEAEIKEKASEQEEIQEEEPEYDINNPQEPEATDSDADIRTAAKDAGISHWHTKSIDRLVNEIKELNDAERSEN